MHEIDCQTHMGRRGFLEMLAAGAVSLLAGGQSIQAEQSEQVIVVDYAWAAMLRGENTAHAEVRWCEPGGVWQVARGTITEKERVFWLTKNIGIDFRCLWERT